MKRFLMHGAMWVIALLLSYQPAVLSADEEKKPVTLPELPYINSFDPRKAQVETVADSIEYQKDTKTIVAKGNVVIQHENIRMTADQAEVETETKKVHAKGHILVFNKENIVAKGDEIFYDFNAHSGHFPDGRLVSFPWFVKAADIQQVRQGVKVAEKAKITTCDLEDPHFEIRAKKVTVYDNDKMIARNIFIYALGKPIFWWPYLVIPMNQNQLPFVVVAGYSSRMGAFIETSKGFSINENIGGKWHLDWRSKRGVGGGVDFNYDYGKPAKGILKTYVTQDKRSPNDSYEGYENKNRGRVTWVHRTDFDPYSNLILRYNRMADEFFLSDFFRKESIAEIEPQSFVTFTKNSENYGFLIHNEKQMNNFESLVEKTPKIQFDWKNQPFFLPGVYYENQISFASLTKVIRKLRERTEDVVRYDMLHQWFMPLRWNNISITPSVDMRPTYYSRQRTSPEDTMRMVYGGGLDMRTHFYKLRDVEFDFAGIEINQLRHVVEPYTTYRFQTSNVSDETLGEFDSIDRIDDAQYVTLGVENRLQTKRVVDGRMQRVDVVSLNTYVSYELYPDARTLTSRFAPIDEEKRTESAFTIAGQEITLRPYNWLQYDMRFEYDLEKSHMRIFNQDVVIRKGRWRVLFGERFLNDNLNFPKSHQYVFDGRFTINPLWTIGGYVRWDPEARDRKPLQEWQISATRDLHDFLLDIGYNVRNSDIEGGNNNTLYFDFRMKAFPRIGVHGGSNRATFSDPRIGETVAGSTPGFSNAYDPYL